MKKRVTYRPSKVTGVMGIVIGAMMALVGLVVVIPMFGAFGVLWTLAALGITIANGYHTFGGKYMGPEITIEDDGPEQTAPEPAEPVIPDAKARLERLEELRYSGLITQKEYEERRERVINSL